MGCYLKVDIMNKCIGCGAILQVQFKEQEGYTKNIENVLCERCFRIKHYNDYQKSLKTNNDYLPILDNINHTNDLVVMVVDLFHTISLKQIKDKLSNDMILVLTKRDVLPYSLYEEKLVRYFKQEFKNIKDIIIISSKNNYHFDDLYTSIMKNKKSSNVYIVGYTNAGKSTMINQLLYHYGDSEGKITTSILPSTTLDTIIIDLDQECKLIDTPGLLEEDSIINHLEANDLKKIIPKKEIKPRIYQVKQDSYFKVDNLIRLNIKATVDVVFYFSGMLSIDRVYKKPKDLEEYDQRVIEIKKDSDLVITGLGFIKFKQDSKISLYLKEDMNYYIRESYL